VSGWAKGLDCDYPLCKSSCQCLYCCWYDAVNLQNIVHLEEAHPSDLSAAELRHNAYKWACPTVTDKAQQLHLAIHRYNVSKTRLYLLVKYKDKIKLFCDGTFSDSAIICTVQIRLGT
jgi:hypothetical protein